MSELDAFVQVMPLLKNILMDDIAVCVTDTKTFLTYKPGDTIDLGNYPGKEIQPQDPLYQAMEKGVASWVIVPKELYGFKFKGISFPIKDTQGKVIGAVGIAKNLDNQSKVEDAAHGLFCSLQQTRASVEMISDNSQQISSSMNNIVKSSKITEQKIQETDIIIKLINDISRKSNLLALNAAIEAARVGEVGKGFSVIAKEMQNFSQMSSSSTKKISNLLIEMKNSIDEIFCEINTTSTVTQTQALSTDQITASLAEITSNSQEMLELSKII